MGKIIGVISLKGGVGKTSTVVSLGGALSYLGKKVLLIDGNLSAPNLGMHLNIIDPEKNLHSVLANKTNVRDAIISLGDFDLLPSSLFSKEQISPLKLKDKIRHLKNDYDAIILDSSPSLNEETLAVMLAADEIIVVTTPDAPTLGTTIKAAKLARQRGTPISGLVLNKVYGKKFELSMDDIENTAEMPVLAVIPHDLNLLKALSEFAPYTQFKPHSEGAEEYKKLAATLIGEKYNPVGMRSFFRWANPTRQDVNRMLFYERVFKE